MLVAWLTKEITLQKIKFFKLLEVDPYFLSKSYLWGIRKHNLYYNSISLFVEKVLFPKIYLNKMYCVNR